MNWPNNRTLKPLVAGSDHVLSFFASGNFDTQHFSRYTIKSTAASQEHLQATVVSQGDLQGLVVSHGIREWMSAESSMGPWSTLLAGTLVGVEGVTTSSLSSSYSLSIVIGAYNLG